MRQTGIWIIAGMLACGGAIAAQPPSGSAGGGEQATVISGGIGLDAREQLAAKARDYNLKLVFALGTGEYLSDVQVEIMDARGKPVTTHVADGPWMFVKLPPGNYTIRAGVADRTQTKKVTVGKQGQKVVNFLWTAPKTASAESAAR